MNNHSSVIISFQRGDDINTCDLLVNSKGGGGKKLIPTLCVQGLVWGRSLNAVQGIQGHRDVSLGL